VHLNRKPGCGKHDALPDHRPRPEEHKAHEINRPANGLPGFLHEIKFTDLIVLFQFQPESPADELPDGSYCLMQFLFAVIKECHVIHVPFIFPDAQRFRYESVQRL
jgi:hypothetical protein